MAYIDTSVLAAYYCPEPLSSEVQAVLGKLKQPVVSSLVEVELYSAVAAKVRASELDQASARRILGLFQTHLDDGHFRIVPVEIAEYRLARDWLGAMSTSLRALDALHMAAAFNNKLTILTADKALARSADHFGVRHELIA